MRFFIHIFTIFIILSCNRNAANKAMMEEARHLMESNRFAGLIEYAEKIDALAESHYADELDSMVDYAGRYLLEFPYTENDILELLNRDSVNADENSLRTWEEAGELEYMWIDGERRYFKYAHRNLYRINDSLRREKRIDEERNRSLYEFCADEIARVIASASSYGYGTPVCQQDIKLNYKITIQADAVPDGEIIRCWMPYPVEGHIRQGMVHLVSSDPGKYIIAPDSTKQRSIYFEKTAVEGKATEFSIELEFRAWSQYYNLPALKGNVSSKGPALNGCYTSERPPHITFSNEIQELAGKIVTKNMDAREKVAAFYRWLNDNIIWTSAIEYGLMPDIPGYVLKNRRGDCGMQTLLFLSLCRYEGIPARWQSGWMLHPGHVNLHDWSEVYIEPAGWVPVDVSFKLQPSENQKVSEFYISGIDSYRLIVNKDYGTPLYPPKKFPRSEPLDFQRGEVEWKGGNIYFNKWKYDMDVSYITP
ncbi:MAG: transglutaminase family protein [Bacteroidales bacterium]